MPMACEVMHRMELSNQTHISWRSYLWSTLPTINISVFSLASGMWAAVSEQHWISFLLFLLSQLRQVSFKNGLFTYKWNKQGHIEKMFLKLPFLAHFQAHVFFHLPNPVLGNRLHFGLTYSKAVFLHIYGSLKWFMDPIVQPWFLDSQSRKQRVTLPLLFV